jgi:hypothetical protein
MNTALKKKHCIVIAWQVHQLNNLKLHLKCNGLQEIARNCKKLQEIARNCKKLQEIARNCKKLQEIARNRKKSN